MADVTTNPNGSARRSYALERAAIDESTRLPVLTFAAFAVLWLLVGTAFALIASIKMHSPEFLASQGWLTFGRVRPAHLNTVIYGWATNVGLGVILWLMARLSRIEMTYPWFLIAAALIWNFGVALGIVGILAGQGTSIEWLEFPPYIPPILATAFIMVSLWSLVMFRRRRESHVYVTQWYIFGAVFWLPWLYTVATLLMLYRPASGAVQAAVNWWFAHNVLGLWLTPVGVGAAYYIIPKVLGRPIHSYYLSIVGFWTLALFYSWAGMHHLIGGPIPVWMVTASVVGSVMMFIPVAAVALNHHMTMVGHFNVLRYSPTLRFVVFGAISYTVVSFQGSLQALRGVNLVTHFTHYTVGHAHLGLYAFYSMIMFGCLYYIVPRLTGWEWYSAKLISLHFWSSAIGILLYFLALSIGGWFQGMEMNNADIPFMTTMRNTVPYLQLRSIAGGLMTIGHLAFATLFVMNLMHIGQARTGPTLFRERSERKSETELLTV